MLERLFGNPFQCLLRDKKGKSIVIVKKIHLWLDPSVVIKNKNGETLSLEDLQKKNRLKITLSPIEPHKVIEIELLPPRPLTSTPSA